MRIETQVRTMADALAIDDDGALFYAPFASAYFGGENNVVLFGLSGEERHYRVLSQSGYVLEAELLPEPAH